MKLHKLVYRLSLVLIFMIAWEGVIEFPRYGTAAKFAGFLLGVVWAIAVVFTGRLRKPNAFLGATFAFVLWNALSVLWSAAPGQSLGQALTFVQLLVFVYILWDQYRTREAVLSGLQTYVLGAYVAIGSAVVNYLSANPFTTHYERFSPGFTHPDGFGFIVAMAVPVAWYLAGSTRSSHQKLWRLVNYGFIPLAFLGLALSGTRTAAVAVIPGMAFGLASLNRLTIYTRLAVFGVLASALYFLLPVVQPLSSFERLGTTHVEATQGNLNGRTDQWREGLAAFPDRPVLGVGATMYRSVNSLGKVAHNSFLSVLIELGLIGFSLFAVVIFIAVISAAAQSKWDRRFWFTQLFVWAIGASTLKWEDRKTTWLFMGLVVASAALKPQRMQAPGSAIVESSGGPPAVRLHEDSALVSRSRT